MKEQSIKNIIDRYLQDLIEQELNALPMEIETEMSGPDQDADEEWQTWFPVESKVTDDEIRELENRIGHKLPEDYKMFLKHKHFYELHISQVSFCSHPVNTWRAELTDMIFDGYPAEYLIEKGYIPFASFSDWGMLCFDANRKKENTNYPVVLWDHEAEDRVENVYLDFYDLMTKLDLEEKEQKK